MKAVVLLGVGMKVSELNEIELINDIDSLSSMEKGKITYLYDEYSKEYVYVGEVLEVFDDLYGDWDFKSNTTHYKMLDEIEEFVYNKYGNTERPKIMIVGIK